MQLYDQRGDADVRQLLHARRPARRAAGGRARSAFPHYILNFERQFQDTVISNFVREYAAGRTPLPCAHCNSDLKFCDAARPRPRPRRGARRHRALRAGRAGGRRPLAAAAQRRSGQGPVVLPVLAHAGSARPRVVSGRRSLTKPEVRAQARRLGLNVAEKPDSQEICFVPDGDYASFVARKAPGRGARRRDRRRARRALGDARRRAPLHRRPAQGARRLRASRRSTC